MRIIFHGKDRVVQKHATELPLLIRLLKRAKTVDRLGALIGARLKPRPEPFPTADCTSALLRSGDEHASCLRHPSGIILQTALINLRADATWGYSFALH